MAAAAPLSGKCALVTGAAGAIGTAIARSLQKAGVNVALLDITADGLAALAGELGALGEGGKVLPISVDISDAAAIEAAVGKIKEAEGFGAPDILINVAGILSNNKLKETSLEVQRSSCFLDDFARHAVCTQSREP